jgi:D-alanyl-D-alanine dipeptidase
MVEASEFISLTDVCPDIRIDPVYATKMNFTGNIIPGYKAKKVLLTRVAGTAICKAQAEARSKGLCLKIFDGYRPAKGVSYFIEWAKLPETNIQLKKKYYPRYTRTELFEKGFIAKKSSHSRGAAVDLTLVNCNDGKDLDMGSPFDFFDSISHTESKLITAGQLINRKLLRDIMGRQNFKNYSKEWWHFNFQPEPFPNQYFDFDIE